MQRISNRTIVVIAGLVTVIFLFAGSAAVAFYNSWLRVAVTADQANGVTAQALPESVVAAAAPVLDQEGSTPPPSVAGREPENEAVVYRQKLDEAYQALDEAYVQIRSLQAAQLDSQTRQDDRRAFAENDDDDGEHREREHRGRERDDH